MLLAVLACVRPDPAADRPDELLTLTDANNFAYEGTLDAPSFPLAELADSSVAWPNLIADLRCHALDPVADIDNAALLVFPRLTEAEVEDGLGNDTLQQVDLGVYLSHEPGDATSVSLSEFTFFGTETDIQTEFEAGSGAWLVLLTTGTGVAIGARMLVFLTPTAGEPATRAEVEDGCPVLDFAADLRSLEPVPARVEGPWRIDWSALTRNGHGGDFVTTRVDSLMVARFEGLSVQDVEERFLDIEILAAETWTWPLGAGTSADLGTLGGFPGFADDGVWMLGLLCSTCPNPAPLFLTVIEPG